MTEAVHSSPLIPIEVEPGVGHPEPEAETDLIRAFVIARASSGAPRVRVGMSAVRDRSEERIVDRVL